MISQAILKKRTLPIIRKEGRLYQKYQSVLARRAEDGEVIESITNSGKETVNRARAGDFVVVNQTGAREQYVVSPEKFRERYSFWREAPDGYSEYRPKGKVLAIELTDTVLHQLGVASEFEYEAPWGERAIAQKGDFLVCPPDESEVYRIGRKEFFETYRPEEQ